MTKDLLTANELDKKVHDYLHYFDINPLLPHLVKVPDGQKLEVLDQTGRANLYYQWLACLVRLIKPEQVLELGASIGISTIMMATQLGKGILYSVDDASDYKTGMKDWEALTYDYPNVVKVVGNDLDLSIYPPDFNLSKTDILFIDTAHNGEQLQKELDLYVPKLEKGSIVVLDDIRLPSMWEVWEKIPYEKLEITNPCHYSGFGFFIK